MVYRLIIVLGIILMFLIQSCTKPNNVDNQTKPCTIITDTLFLENPYSSWFSEISTDYYEDRFAIFHSNNGLSESMDILKYNVLYNEHVIRSNYDPDPCIQHYCQGYYVSNTSSMYNFTFDYKIYQYSDGIHLCFRDYGSAKFDYMRYDYNLTKQEGMEIGYAPFISNNLAYQTICENININLNGTITNVYKITNTLALNEGLDLDIVTVYLDKDKGLVRFEQKNGVYWVRVD